MNRPLRLLISVATACVVAAVLGAPRAFAEAYDVYLMAGQSNMDGRGLVEELRDSGSPYVRSRADIRFWYANPWGAGYSTGWIDLAPGYSIPPGFKKGPQTLPSGTFGTELSFGATLADASGSSHIALIKVSRGGTSLVRDWAPDLPGEDTLYRVMLRTVEDALKALEDQGHTARLRGVVWHQGESDRKSKKYAQHLDAFIERLRGDLGQDDLPFVIGEVFDNGKRDLVREAQRTVADRVPATALVTSEGLEASDGTHFTSDSVLLLGERFAHTMQQLQAPASRVSDPSARVPSTE